MGDWNVFQSLSIDGNQVVPLRKERIEGTSINRYEDAEHEWFVIPHDNGFYVPIKSKSKKKMRIDYRMVLPEVGEDIQTSGKELRRNNFFLKVSGENVKFDSRRDPWTDFQSNPFWMYAEGEEVNVYVGYDFAADIKKDVLAEAAGEQRALGKKITGSSKSAKNLNSEYKETLVSDLNIINEHQIGSDLVMASNGLRTPDYGKGWGRDIAFLYKARKALSEDCGGIEEVEELQEKAAEFLAKGQLKEGDAHCGMWPQKIDRGGKPAKIIWENWGDPRMWQPDDQLSMPFTIMLERGRTKEAKRSLAAFKSSVFSGSGEFAKVYECDNSWEDRYGEVTFAGGHWREKFPMPYSAIISFLEAGNAMKNSQDKEVKEYGKKLADSVYKRMNEDFWLDNGSNGSFKGYVRNAIDKGNPYDSAALYVDPLIDYVDGLKENKGEFRKGVERIKSTLLSQMNYDSPISRAGDPGLTRVVGGKKQIVRYNGDKWNGKDWPNPAQQHVWPLSSLMASYSCLRTGNYLKEINDRDASRFRSIGKELLDNTLDMNYLPEQLSNSGEYTSGTPLAWAHAMRALSILELGKSG